MAAGGCASLDLEGFEKQLQSLFKSFKNSSSATIDAVQVDRGQTFCSDFSQLVEEYTCHHVTPLPRLRILEVALCYFVRGSYLFRVGCDDVRSMLSSLALSVFELLLFFAEKDLRHDPLKHFTVTFQECHMCLVRHQNVHLIQVSSCIQDGGPWANSTLQSILKQSTIPQTEVDIFISSQLPVLLELRVRYLLTCERVSEAMALAKCCSQHPTAGQHHFFLQVYLTCLHKTSQHDRLNKEVAHLDGKDAVQIICNMESEERDQSIVLTLARAFLSQQLCRGGMDHLSDLVFIWSKLQLRLQTPKQVLLEEIQQLMLTATNVNSIFPFIKVILEELGKDGHQFCVELCTKALQSCLPCDVPTKSLIYKTLAGLFPNDLEMCQVCALLVFFLERTVEAFKMVFSLYIHPDQEDHAQASPVSNQVRFETLQVLKTGMHFDPEFWNHITLRANCLDLLSETVESAALEEIMEMWVPDYCMKEPDFHLNTNSSNFQQRTKVAGAKRGRTKYNKNHMTAKRLKSSSDHSVKKRRNPGKRSVKKASTEYLKQCFWQLGKTQEDSRAYQLIRLSEKNPPKRNISNLQWIIEDPELLEQSTPSDYRKLRPNAFFFLDDMPYLYTSVSPVTSNSAAAKSQHPQTIGAQDSHKDPQNMKPAVVLTPLPLQMVRHALCPPAPQQQCSSVEDEDDSVYDSDTSWSKKRKVEQKEGRNLNEDGTSKTRTPQANTNVFFFLGDMPYLYTSVSPVAPNRPAAKSQHPQTSRAQDSHKDPLNMELAVVLTKLDSQKDQLNMEPALVVTELDSQTDQLNMEPTVVLTKLDSHKDPLNMELAVVLTKLDSHKDLLNMERVVVHTKLDSHTDPLNLEPAVVLTKVDSHTDPLNLEPAVVLTKLDSHEDPLNMEAAVILTPLPLDMVRHALGPPAPQQQFSSSDEEYEDSVYDTDMREPTDDNCSDDEWLEYAPRSRRRTPRIPGMPRQRRRYRMRFHSDQFGVFACSHCTSAYTSEVFLFKHIRRTHNKVYRQMLRDGEIPVSLPVTTGEIPVSLPVTTVDTTSQKEDSDDEAITYSHRLSTRPLTKKTYIKRTCLTRTYIKRTKEPITCTFCCKIFKTLYLLKSHQRVHTGEKSFQCDQCDKSFSHLSNLKRHQSVHTGLKPFQCKWCDKSFSQIDTLRRHHRVHTGEKPFQCRLCAASFTERSSLKNHEKNIHNIT